MRKLCRGQTAPMTALYRAFDIETDNGRKMQTYSCLLEDAVNSILDAKEDNDLEPVHRRRDHRSIGADLRAGGF